MKIIILALLVATVYTVDFKGDKVYRITPNNEAQVKLLRKWIDGNQASLDVWREPSAPGHNADIHVPKKDCASVIAMLKQNGIPFVEMVRDLENLLVNEELSNQKNAFSSWFQYDKYNQWGEIKMEMQYLSRMYPYKARIFNVGKTYYGNDQIGLKVTNGDRIMKPAVWIDGGIHAREWISPATVMYFLKKLITSNEKEVTDALDKYDFYILPVFNIDGYTFTHSGRNGRLWRKTRRPTSWGCIGADPNRNWDSHFGGAGTSGNPCSDIYHGGKAFSEIEVRNVADYLKTIPNLISYWNVHAYSQLVLTPWSYTKRLPTDYSEIKRVADVFVDKVKRKYGTMYVAGPPSKVLYPVAGGSIDWVYEKLGVRYSYALELRDRGQYGFVLPANQIIPTGEETTDALLAAVMAI